MRICKHDHEHVRVFSYKAGECIINAGVCIYGGTRMHVSVRSHAASMTVHVRIRHGVSRIRMHMRAQLQKKNYRGRKIIIKA